MSTRDDLYERARALRNAVLWQSNASVQHIVRAMEEERRIAIAEAAEAIRCDCCDVCGESPEYEHGACANVLAERVLSLSTDRGERDDG